MKAWHALLVFAGIAVGMLLSPKWESRAQSHPAVGDVALGRTVSGPGDVALLQHQAPSTDAQLAKILERLERLEAAQSASSAPGRSAREPGSHVVPFAAPPSDPAESKRAYGELFDKTLKAQPRDSGWARQTETEINDALRSADLSAGNQITDLECKQSLCRLQVKHSTRAASDFLPMSLPMSLPGLGSAWFVQDDDHGQLSTLFYFARKGSTLPALPELEVAAAAH